ncbi:putative (R)-mandelonitrile lyase [Rosa chinensis]|uniref:Putative (R)-mandelonitrile lyase n=1 Tax=Rosa chinensis TaxID=74649 RepID=A0A2P6RMY0_ROSCH|nr:(R)-mandelonitrile lyase-like [Rosa chinensis]PRQ47799.1 putative (R)-mandelonitrile lyase [Rosa chinensis]
MPSSLLRGRRLGTHAGVVKSQVTLSLFPTPLGEYYKDYIISGGGTAGCPLAATLSSRFRVLLLKSGGVAYGNQNLMSQDGFCQNSWMSMPTQAFTSEDGVPNVQGRILGGSRAMNAGFYIPADQEFFERSTFN